MCCGFPLYNFFSYSLQNNVIELPCLLVLEYIKHIYSLHVCKKHRIFLKSFPYTRSMFCYHSEISRCNKDQLYIYGKTLTCKANQYEISSPLIRNSTNTEGR
jgi:hypothetical protein